MFSKNRDQYSSKKMGILLSLQMIMAIFLTSSCVGEYQTVDVNLTESTEENPVNSLKFKGIQDAIAVADDKIEVYFYPADGGSESYSYTVSIGNYDEEFTASSDTLTEDYRGFHRMLIDGLAPGTSYTFKIDVAETGSDTIIESENTLSATTFENDVSDFYGISSVSNAVGEAGLDSINVRWVPTDKKSELGTDDSDPSSYEIIAVNALLNTPEVANDYTFTEEDGRYVFTEDWIAGLNSTTISGLEAGTPYYIFVRVLHVDSINDSSKPYLRSELNNKYIEISTYSADDTSISVTGDEFVVEPLGGVKATSSLNASWGDVNGVFNHFRVFYSSGSLSSIDTTTCDTLTLEISDAGGIACKEISASESSVVLSDLTAYTNYNVQLVVCVTEDCSVNYFASSLLCEGSSPDDRCHAVTEPSLDSFTGISTVTNASSVSEIGEIYLTYLAPTFEEGYFEGLLVEYTTERSDLLLWLENEANGKPDSAIINMEVPGYEYTGDLIVDNFDITDELITVSGLDYSSEGYHCFSIYPYVYDTEGNIDFSNYSSLTKVWKCTTTSIDAPTVTDFAGFASGSSPKESSYVSLVWTKPSSGVYSHYEIFYRDVADPDDPDFNLTTAIQETTVDFSYTNYDRIFFSSTGGDGTEVTNKTTSSLEDGYYIFGIVTYYPGTGSTPIRSEESPNKLLCQVDSSSTSATNCTLLTD